MRPPETASPDRPAFDPYDHDPDHWGYLSDWDALIAQGWTKDRLIGWSPDIDGKRP